MIKPLHNAAQITNAIAIAVLKAAGVDLVNHRPTPPIGVCVHLLNFAVLRHCLLVMII
jgi:hypothetical protein